ncbi:MAG: ABC transporter ATP-binding protein, partial [Streptosporangiaceae bacterium]
MAGVFVSYGKTVALGDVSLAAAAGQVTAVVGGDGAGKSTLLRCLAGLISPASGEVRTPGAARIGYLPGSSGIYPDLTVTENLEFRAAAYGMAPAQIRARAAEFLDRTGLADVPDRMAGQLSGGMRQKLGVIAAMLHQPDLLVLDEPTTGVDPVSRSDLWWLIARAAAAGTAVVLATSYLDEAERAATVLVLDGGRELAAGTPAQIVAAVPGVILVSPVRPAGPAAQRAWRRSGEWRIWMPRDSPSIRSAQQVQPDLQDAVTVAALARELRLQPPVAGADSRGQDGAVRDCGVRDGGVRDSGSAGQDGGGQGSAGGSAMASVGAGSAGAGSAAGPAAGSASPAAE